MFCPHCGTRLPDDARFCDACGARLGGATSGARPGDAPARQQPATSQGKSPRHAAARRRPATPVIVIAASLVIIAIAVAAIVHHLALPPMIDERSFPDAGVRELVASTYDTDHDGRLSPDEGNAVTEMHIDEASEVTNLGAHFPNVTVVVISCPTLSTLDVGDLGHLRRLDVTNSPITTLDLSRNGELAELTLTGTDVGSIDLSGNHALASLDVDDDVQVIGTEATGLKVAWLPMEVTADGGMTASVERDAQGRATSLTASDPAYGGTLRYAFSYAPDGRVSSVSMPEGDSSASGQVTATPSYDDAARVTGLAGDAHGTTLDLRSYTYDDAGLLTLVEMEGGGGNGWEYDDQGRPTRYLSQLMVPAEEWTYDDQERVATHNWQDDGGITLTSLTYGDDGLVTSVEGSSGRNLEAAVQSAPLERRIGGVEPFDVTCTADADGRLATETYASRLTGTTRTATFEYDDAGNLSQVTDDTGSVLCSATWKRYVLPRDAETPDALLQVGPTYDDELAGAGYWTLPDARAGASYDFALFRSSYKVL